MKCRFCGEECIKDGRQANGKQRYKCSHCHKRQQEHYSYNAYSLNLKTDITTLTKEGVGIRSTARILQISPTTLLHRIILIAKSITRPPIVKHRIYEVDEIKSFVRRKSEFVWIAYALDRKSKEVVSYNIGPRTNSTLGVVLETPKLSENKQILYRPITKSSFVDRPENTSDIIIRNEQHRAQQFDIAHTLETTYQTHDLL